MKRVLVVDDDPDALALLRDTFVRAGFDVLTELDPERVLERLANGESRILVTDWVMRGVDGLELCRAIRKQERYTYVILVTALTTLEHLVQVFDAGADDYVRKPFAPAELVARARTGQRILSMNDELDARFQALCQSKRQLEVAHDVLQRVANEDELTGLPNRRRALRELDQFFSSRRLDRPAPVCAAIEIAGLGQVNARIGMEAADQYVRFVGRRLLQACAAGEFVARVGGARFLFLGRAVAGDSARRVAALRDAVCSAPFVCASGAIETELTTALIVPVQAANPEGVLALADRALRGLSDEALVPAASATA